MTLEQFYAAVGGDYEQTLSRLPSEALVKKFVLKYVDDGTCKELAEALRTGTGPPRSARRTR